MRTKKWAFILTKTTLKGTFVCLLHDAFVSFHPQEVILAIATRNLKAETARFSSATDVTVWARKLVLRMTAYPLMIQAVKRCNACVKKVKSILQTEAIRHPNR